MCRAGQGSDQPVVVEDVPAYCKEAGLDNLKHSFPPKPFYHSMTFYDSLCIKEIQEALSKLRGKTATGIYVFFYIVQQRRKGRWRPAPQPVFVAGIAAPVTAVAEVTTRSRLVNASEIIQTC